MFQIYFAALTMSIWWLACEPKFAAFSACCKPWNNNFYCAYPNPIVPLVPVCLDWASWSTSRNTSAPQDCTTWSWFKGCSPCSDSARFPPPAKSTCSFGCCPRWEQDGRIASRFQRVVPVQFRRFLSLAMIKATRNNVLSVLKFMTNY